MQNKSSRSPVQFMDREIEEQLAKRDEHLNRAAKSLLEEYLYLLDKTELQSTKLSAITDAERGLIFDSLNGVMIEPLTMHLLWANVDDSIKLNALDTKHGVNGDELIQKLRGLSMLETFCLWDIVRRYWNA